MTRASVAPASRGAAPRLEVMMARQMLEGLDDVEHLTVDPALVRLRDDPRFPEIGERRPASGGQPR